MSNRTRNSGGGTDVIAGRAAVTTRARQRIAPARRQATGISGASRAAIAKALDMVGQSVFFLNTDLRVVDVNDAACRSSGYCRDELWQMQLGDILADEENALFRARLERVLRGEANDGTLPVRQRTKTGGLRSVRIELGFLDQTAEALLVVVVEDADQGEPCQRPCHDTSCDYLTGLPARAALDAHLRWAERRARQEQGGFAILFIDVDRLKTVNDANGHRAGDAVLRALGRRLQASVRPCDFVARYGGDEFVAVIDGVRGKAEVERVVQRFHTALSAPIDVAGRKLQITASIGAAVADPESLAETLLDEADQAMYREKRRTSKPAIGATDKNRLLG